MTKEYTPEEIKYRLSDLGVQIGNIAINYITELEKRIAELEATCNKWFEHLKNREEELLNELNNQNAKYNKQIAEVEQEVKLWKKASENNSYKAFQLEQENAELKAQLESERDLPAIAYMQGAEKQKKKDEEHLTKAKELLEKLLLVSCNSEVLNQYPNCSKVLQARVEAEQFLYSEVEK